MRRATPGVVVCAWALAGALAPTVGRTELIPSFGVQSLYWAAMISGSVMCAVAAHRERANRLAWALIALAGLAWVLGDVYYVCGPQPSITPSYADVGYLLFYPLAAAGILSLAQGPHLTPISSWGRRAQLIRWIDGTAVALALNAAGAAVFLTGLDLQEGYRMVPLLTTLAYPVLTAALLAAFVSILARRQWTVRPRWWLLGLGVIVFWTSDAGYVASTATGSYQAGSWVDAGWMAALACFGLAAGLDDPPPMPKPHQRRVIVVPTVFAFLALVVLIVSALLGLNPVAVVLSALALCAVLIRLALTLVDNEALIRNARQEARTDALTGLANRRALLADLQHICRTGAPFVLALYDMNGFKSFNDTFGHAAGDALLARLGARMSRVLGGHGTAYRLGGDEYCVLLEAGRDWQGRLESVAAALDEEGDGYAVSGSGGHVLIPGEAREPGRALQIADERMYAAKAARAAALAVTEGSRSRLGSDATTG